MKIEIPEDRIAIDASVDQFLGASVRGWLVVDGEGAPFMVLIPPPGEPDKVSAVMLGRSLLCTKVANPKDRSIEAFTAAAKAAVTELVEFEHRQPIGINWQAAGKLPAKPRKKSRPSKSRRRG